MTGPDGERGWLFGTIHSMPDGVGWRSAAVDRALAASDVLVVEIADLGDREQAMETLAARSRTPGLPPLSQRVADKDRPALLDLMARAGTTDDDFATTESWAAGLALAARVREFEPENGVDRALLAGELPVVGLESYAEQFDRFDRLPQADQADLLAGIARESADERNEARLVAWLTGDLATLERDAAYGILAYPRLREALLAARNRAWIGRIDQLLRARRTPFVAVGAGHMLGTDGLPALLAARGYTVTRVR